MYEPGTQVRIIADENGAPVGTVVTVTDMYQTIPAPLRRPDVLTYSWDGYDGWLSGVGSVEPV